MKFPVFLTSLLAASIGLCSLSAGEPPQPAGADDVKKAAEEKSKRNLADLAKRFQKLLDSQIAVRDATKSLAKSIQDTPDKKPRPEDKRAALELAAKEKELVRDMAKAIDLIEAEGTGVALAEVCHAERKDMERLQRCLENGDVGMDTVALENDLIGTLEEMTTALTSSR